MSRIHNETEFLSACKLKSVADISKLKTTGICIICIHVISAHAELIDNTSAVKSLQNDKRVNICISWLIY